MATKKTGRKDAAKGIVSQFEKAMGKNAKGTYKCKICGKAAKNSVDASTHLIDHAASALESVSALIKDQEEGRVSRTKGT